MENDSKSPLQMQSVFPPCRSASARTPVADEVPLRLVAEQLIHKAAICGEAN